MPEGKSPPPKNETLDSFAVREYGPPPTHRRKEMLEKYVGDVDRLQRCTVTAGLLTKQEPTAATLGALGAIVAEMQEGLEDLQRRRPIVLPKVRHKDDDTDEVYDAGFHASEFIYRLEALLTVIRDRVEQQRDGHLVTLCDLCWEQMPQLRHALYGKEMEP